MSSCLEVEGEEVWENGDDDHARLRRRGVVGDMLEPGYVVETSEMDEKWDVCGDVCVEVDCVGDGWAGVCLVYALDLGSNERGVPTTMLVRP